MKAVILAGGFGTRLSEETDLRPKPMVEIGGRPILWHIMQIYSAHGINDFIICLGYKAQVIKEYFLNFSMHNSSLEVDLGARTFNYLDSKGIPNWKIQLVDTGVHSMTGGRLKRVAHLLEDEPFCMTYGDGVSDVNISELIDHHIQAGTEATVTTVRPSGRFGATIIENGKVSSFEEKPPGDGASVNGGFFVLNPTVFDRIDGDETIWEQDPLKGLAADGQLAAFPHEGFWQPMDTLRDKTYLEGLLASGKAPWVVWEDER